MAATQQDFVARVVGAASQGAVGAFVAATLSAVTEPVVNNVLVNRVPLAQAISELQWARVYAFLQTTLSTNFIKFPFFEATNVIMSGVDLNPFLRGTVTGAVFCSTTLPITNYRFRKSMSLPITPASLYQAYLPTVLRDIIYGITRNQVMTLMFNLSPERAGTNAGRFMNMFATVMAACVISAPGNELRGYCLQDPARALPFKDFFKPEKFIRSTTVGALIMSISLGVGTLATPQVEKVWGVVREFLKKNPAGYGIMVLLAVVGVVAASQKKAIGDGDKAKTA